MTTKITYTVYLYDKMVDIKSHFEEAYDIFKSIPNSSLERTKEVLIEDEYHEVSREIILNNETI